MNTFSFIQSLLRFIDHKFESIQASKIEIPEDLVWMQTEIKEEPYEMSSLAWQTPHIKFARLTHLSSPSRIELFNFTVYPHTHLEASVFASDFVMLNQKLRVAVIDAMPLFPNDADYKQHWVNPFESFFQESLLLSPVYERKLDWSYHFMSPFACLATQMEESLLPQLYQLWVKYFEQYLLLLENAPILNESKSKEATQWHQHYNQTHLEVELQRNPLKHYFGEAKAERYFCEFLFGDR